MKKLPKSTLAKVHGNYIYNSYLEKYLTKRSFIVVFFKDFDISYKNIE